MLSPVMKSKQYSIPLNQQDINIDRQIKDLDVEINHLNNLIQNKQVRVSSVLGRDQNQSMSKNKSREQEQQISPLKTKLN